MEYEREPYRGKVIIINDAPGARGRLARWLKQRGYEYTFVDNMDQANELLAYVDFDTIVSCREFLFSGSVF